MANRKTKRRSGNMVYLTDDPNSNSLGHLGKVIKVYPDSKGLVRSVRLRVKDKELVRPVAKLKLFLRDERSSEDKIEYLHNLWFHTRRDTEQNRYFSCSLLIHELMYSRRDINHSTTCCTAPNISIYVVNF